MKDLYVDTVDDLPQNAPKPVGKPIHINYFVDSDHASDRVNICSQNAILLYYNITPIILYHKKQNSVESSTSGLNLVAMRIVPYLII